ncbi:helix-turn-helix domain-containing protein [Thalassotalea euphylliae]|uniref:helix-turn-helix domain-containing protein n=1 Tax=Thalassotalea euphylliae TaxID=1655234 RepID=UPI00362534BE
MSRVPKPKMLTEAVNNLLGDSDLPAALTLEQCASALAMSTTSFRRKLSQEETSYKLIQTKFLNELCVMVLSLPHVKIDDLAVRLGYSERATFERAFRQKFGLTPSQFRELTATGLNSENEKELKTIAQNIPAMPDSCRELLQEKDQGNLDVQRVLDIVSKDPIFSGRLMGQASKAIYGKTPDDLREAITRNLGINTVLNFAVIFAMQDALSEQVSPKLIEKYSQAFMLAPKLFQKLRRSLSSSVKFDVPLVEQVLVFGLLGVFLLSHKDAKQHELVIHSLRGIEDLQVLNSHVKQTGGISIYMASALMLSQWHIDANVIKMLTDLDKLSDSSEQGTPEQELVQFMFACMYQLAGEHEIDESTREKAQWLGIDTLDEILEEVVI